jgi:protein gp37
MDKTGIEWTDATWNPVTGCDEVGIECIGCYLKGIAERLRGTKAFPNGFDLSLRPERLNIPLHWRKPRMIFVNSMSDLFHKEIPTEYIDKVFDVMERADWHIFQVLTKRSSLMRDYINARYQGRVPGHMWMGVSVGIRTSMVRIEHLRQSRATVRFLSLEPLLESLGKLDLAGIHWVIAGGESGINHRPIDPDWVREIRDQCQDEKVPFFFKQWGGRTSKSGGCELDGLEYKEWPRLWDAATDQQIGLAMKHNGSISRALLTKEQIRILSWSAYHTLRLWNAAAASDGEPQRYLLHRLPRR